MHGFISSLLHELRMSIKTKINNYYVVYVQLVLYLQVNIINIIFYHEGHHMNVVNLCI